MSLRTPLSRALGLGSAKDGVGHWWAQRVTAAALVPLLLWLAVSLAGLAGADRAAAVAWVRTPHVTVALLLVLPVLFYHAQLGLQVVVEDYVHASGPRLAVVVLLKFLSAALALAAVVAVLRVSLGG